MIPWSMYHLVHCSRTCWLSTSLRASTRALLLFLQVILRADRQSGKARLLMCRGLNLVTMGGECPQKSASFTHQGMTLTGSPPHIAKSFTEQGKHADETHGFFWKDVFSLRTSYSVRRVVSNNLKITNLQSSALILGVITVLHVIWYLPPLFSGEIIQLAVLNLSTESYLLVKK